MGEFKLKFREINHSAPFHFEEKLL